ncbi:Bromodomain adjacent to zinc finger domain protein 2B, partial [Manis javanica]
MQKYKEKEIRRQQAVLLKHQEVERHRLDMVWRMKAKLLLKIDNSKAWILISNIIFSSIMILTEIENHEDARPFHLPVNLNFVPGYTKVIKKPMDFSTIREKLISGQYPNLEAFAVDVRLVFDNCEAFNQDDSDTGRAGHSMRKYFEKKWTDTLKRPRDPAGRVRSDSSVSSGAAGQKVEERLPVHCLPPLQGPGEESRSSQCPTPSGYRGSSNDPCK